MGSPAVSPDHASFAADRASAEDRARYLNGLEDALTGFSTADPPLPGSPFPVQQFDPGYRDEGFDWPSTALTMVGRRRLHNFRELIERAIDEGIPGDILEAGVWRGGASILARAVLASRGVTDRRIIVADSFEGLPPPSEEFPADAGAEFHTHPELAVSLEQVRANFDRFGLLDEQVVFLKGWFRDTMPLVDAEALAVLRLDGDMYESTIVPLEHLYDRLSPGGWVIVDDYHLMAACREAVQDFLAARGIDAPLHDIDRVGVYFRKH
ncbi:MAG: TylF/MycF/NovP-related O-methyltransferase [Acidimicrobiales bacterium]